MLGWRHGTTLCKVLKKQALTAIFGNFSYGMDIQGPKTIKTSGLQETLLPHGLSHCVCADAFSRIATLQVSLRRTSCRLAIAFACCVRIPKSSARLPSSNLGMSFNTAGPPSLSFAAVASASTFLCNPPA